MEEASAERAVDTLIDQAFILSDGQVISADELGNHLLEMKRPLQKAMPGSQQPESKDPTAEITKEDIVQPPYDPRRLAAFLDLDEIHFRCVRVKVSDSIGREVTLSKDPIFKDAAEDIISAEISKVRDFMDGANDVHGFDGVLEKAAMDFESVGWAAIEVVRSFNKEIKHLYHVPAERIRVLRGWKGFIELGDSASTSTFFLPFGQKVLSPTRKNIDGESSRFDPVFDDAPIERGVWNLRSRTDLNKKLGFGQIKESANELLFIPKRHPKTIYYGIPDFIPALGSIIGNLNIRDFFLEFFEHNTVPQYAVIIKGAKLSSEVKDLIQHYFTQEIKGQAHKTLILPIPAAGGDVEVEFKPLSVDTKEGSFQETRKNNQKSIIISHGTSPAIIGLVEGSSLGAGKGTAQHENYKNRVVEPIQKHWARVLKRLFRWGLGVRYVRPEFDALDAEDKTAQRQNLVAYTVAGAMTVNELRERAKLGPPIAGGDVAFVLSGGVPIPLENLGGTGGDDEASMKALEDTLRRVASRESASE